MPATDMTGRTYGKLTVVERAGSTRTGQATWLARCTCGNTTVVSGAFLRKGHTKSCGCLHKETISSHGMAATRTYQAWRSMRNRCATHPAYANIKVCGDWNDSFEAFFRDMGECPDGLTLDRIDGTKDYEPGNCRWATMRVQVRNRTTNKLDERKAREIREDTRTTKELAVAYGVHEVTIRQVRRGVIWA